MAQSTKTWTEGGRTFMARDLGSRWLVTSPDVPGLYLAHKDLQVAIEAIPGTIKVLWEAQERANRRIEITQQIQGRRVA